MRLAPYIERHQLGSIAAPGAVIFGKNELQPDIQVIPGPSRRPRGTNWEDLPKPILVIDEGGDRVFAFSADSDEPVKVTDALRWQPRPDLPPLEIPLESILPPPAAAI